MAVSKNFPGYGIFTGKVVLYAPRSDTFKIIYTDGDDEVLTYADMRKIVTSRTPQTSPMKSVTGTPTPTVVNSSSPASLQKASSNFKKATTPQKETPPHVEALSQNGTDIVFAHSTLRSHLTNNVFTSLFLALACCALLYLPTAAMFGLMPRLRK